MIDLVFKNSREHETMDRVRVLIHAGKLKTARGSPGPRGNSSKSIRYAMRTRHS